MLKKLMKKEEGFTLAELLIVVAIIAVLVAVSIPIFTAQLEKSRESTDIANLRAAKAAFIAEYLTDGEKMSNGDTYSYNAQSGILSKDETATMMKGTGNDPGTYTASNNEYGYKSNTDYTGTGITLKFTKGSGSDADSVEFSTGGTLDLGA